VINPEVSTVTVGDTPTLLFQGSGRVQIVRVPPNNSNVCLGDSNVSFGSTASQWRVLPADTFQESFEADAELYGVTASGTTQVVRVTRWF
jgi:hypothetical protein